MKKTILLVAIVALSLNSHSQQNTNPRAMWFTDARFGMFIHWGVYSGAEGIWKGEKLRNNNDYAEWIYYRNRIARDEYITLLDRFDWDKIDPEAWVILAKNAGMKYVTLTAKHHDGFALWDSQVSDYDIAEFTSPKRDIVKELASACKKHGLKLGLYYSHWVDWEHPDGWDHSKEIYGISPEAYDRYWQGKVIPQMKELLTNYGDIGMIWFDMWIHHSHTCVTKEQLLQLKGLIRDLQPDCLVNSRLGLSIEEDSDIDYKTLGDNQLGSKKEEFPWQSPATVAHSWGFHSLEDQWKSSTTLLQSLIGNVSLNGNYMLNIGPRANGDVPYEIEQRLLDMGKWLSVNGESIYGSQAFDLVKDQHDWGKITCKQHSDGRTSLYLHVYNWPLNHKLPVTGIMAKPEKSYLLADPDKASLSFTSNEVVTLLDLPAEAPDPLVSVVVLEYGSYPSTEDGLVAQSVYGGFSLTPSKAVDLKGDTRIQLPTRRGTVPAHIEVTRKSTYRWRIFVDRPLTLHADVSYSFQGEEGGGTLSISSHTGTLKANIEPTGKFVGEPNSDWQIASFDSHRLGQLHFSEAGFYDISLEIEPGKEEPLDFQWLWLEEVRQDLAKKPQKPTVLEEGHYEGISRGDTVEAIHVRRQAYQTFFSGGAGFTYGGYFDEQGNGPLFSPYNNWQALLNLEGAGQIQYLKSILLDQDWEIWDPNPDLIVDNRGMGELEKLAVKSGKELLIYFPDNTSCRINEPGKLRSALWYNPSTGLTLGKN